MMNMHRFGMLIFCTSLLFATGMAGLRGQETILEARHRPLGSVVTIRGIVLSGEELGAVRYLQDSTAGIAVYPGGNSPGSFAQVTRSDEVQITGVLSTYHGLLEINPILSFQKLSTGNVLPEAEEMNIDALSFHDQGKLIRIKCVRFPSAPGKFESGSLPFCTSRGAHSFFYFEGNHPLVDSPLPAASLDITALVSYSDDWRFLIRSIADLEATSCFHMVPTPLQSELSQEGFRLEWMSSENAAGFCFVKRENAQADTLRGSGFEQMHSVDVTGLIPAEFYEVTAGGVNDQGDTALYRPIMMSTQSASSGEIRVYFNKSIDVSYSNGSAPDGTTFGSMLGSILDLINNAQHTLDVAMYNSNRSDIILALEQAMQRGVRVRYIGDGGQSNSALDPLPDFPLLFRDGDGIMHHKFILVDAQDPTNATVWTGSTNHSTNQLSGDPNNAIVIRDQALAKAYLKEFEEMWGGSGAVPNPLMSRTGSAKRDDTPHFFQIGNVPVQCFFSPSDQTNHELLTALMSSEESIDVALLLLTRYDLAEAMADRATAESKVRVIIDDFESSIGPLQELQSGGVLTAHHDYNSIFHHKYAIIDEGTDNARLITGSHNWTTSATVRNDENTLILFDRDIANIYRQEFEARWAEVFSSAISNASAGKVTVFPNPSRDVLYIESYKEISSISAYAVSGNHVRTQITHGRMDVSFLTPGLYFLLIEHHDGEVLRAPFVRL